MKVALCGFYGKKNFGDNLLQRYLSKILSSPNNIVTVYSDTNTDGVVNFKDDSFLINDVFVIGGGGLVTENFWIWKENMWDQIKHKHIFLLNVNLTNEFFGSYLANKETGLLSEKIHWWVRDCQSLNKLKELGANAEFIPDIVFDNVAPFKEKKKQVAVFLNAYIFNDLFKNDNLKFCVVWSKLVHLANYLDWMIENGNEVVIIPSQYNKDFDDRPVSGILYGLIKNRHKTTLLYGESSEDEIIDYIKTSHLVISTKYHPTAICLASQIKFIDITHHNKNKQLLVDCEVTQYSVDFYSFDKDLLIKKTKYIENNFVPLDEKKFEKTWDFFKKEWEDFCTNTNTIV